jgi:hypothetical protein
MIRGWRKEAVMKNVNLESQIDRSVRTQLKSARTSTPKRASEGRRQLNEWDSHRASAVSRSHGPAATQESPDFLLIRDVQMRATGANIHAVAQQLQIYVSAIECGAKLHALAVESQLRAFLASGR